jgi:hypothetical protein
MLLQNLQRKTDKFVVTAREFSSRGTSFLIVMLGVILQASHTTLLMYNVAGFEQKWLKFLVALGIGLFLSCALALFTLKWDGKDKTIKNLITQFFYFEVFTNVFYYWNSIIFEKGIENAVLQDWIYIVVLMPFSYMVPFAIKQFAGIIAADEPVAFGNIDVPPSLEKEIPEEEFNEYKEKLKLLIDQTDSLKLNNEELNEKVNGLSEDQKLALKKLEDINPDTFIKKGSKVELTVNDKKSIITLE